MAFRAALGSTPTFYLMDIGALSLGVKWPGHEADHSLQTSAEVKKKLVCASTPSILLHGIVLN
jgi:hypothetical protein